MLIFLGEIGQSNEISAIFKRRTFAGSLTQATLGHEHRARFGVDKPCSFCEVGGAIDYFRHALPRPSVFSMGRRKNRSCREVATRIVSECLASAKLPHRHGCAFQHLLIVMPYVI